MLFMLVCRTLTLMLLLMKSNLLYADSRFCVLRRSCLRLAASRAALAAAALLSANSLSRVLIPETNCAPSLKSMTQASLGSIVISWSFRN